MRVDLPLDKKKIVENQGSPGHKVVAGRGPWAAGRWATGLLLAKPACVLLSVCSLHFTLSLQFTLGPLSAVVSPQSAVRSLRFTLTGFLMVSKSMVLN